MCQSPLKYIILSPENYLAGIYVGFILRWFKEEIGFAVEFWAAKKEILYTNRRAE